MKFPSLSHRKRAFLAAFAECGVISRAATESKCSRRNHVRWLEEDGEYAIAFAEAHDEANDKLESEARRRAHDGLLRMKFYQGAAIIDPRTNQPYVEHEYSDTLLMFLLNGERPQKFKHNVDMTSGGKPVNFTLNIGNRDSGSDPI